MDRDGDDRHVLLERDHGGARLNLARAVVNVGDVSPVTAAPKNARVAATAALLGLPAFTPRTAAALAPLTGNPPQLVATALASPESCVSA